MSSVLVPLVYVAALALPLFLLYQFRARTWYWHVLCVAAALALGFIPTPPAWKTLAVDMAFGFCFIVLIVWGLGGLMLFHGPKGSHRHA
jgi:hypothetical protein